jgi:protein tyrosine/serine phosphatase
MAKSDDTLEFLYQYGSHIWEQMRFSRVRNQRISETTITENLIFDFWCQAKKDHLPVEIYRQKQKNRTGMISKCL